MVQCRSTMACILVPARFAQVNLASGKACLRKCEIIILSDEN
jgi:hypothetical protein